MISHRRAKVVSYLMSKSELRDLRRHSGVIVEEGYDARVEGALLCVTPTSQVLCIGLVLLTDTSTCT